MESEDERWNQLKQTLKIGQEVEGVVVHKAPFGDFIDIGMGFMALLEIIQMPELTPDKYRAGDYSPVGSKIKARICLFGDSNKQVLLTQKPL